MRFRVHEVLVLLSVATIPCPTGNNNMLTVFLLDHTFKHVHNFLGMMQVVMSGMPLVARLRPAATRCAADRAVVHALLAPPFADAEDEQPRRVGADQQCGIAPVLIIQTRQRAEMRLVVHGESMLRDGRVELHGREAIIGAGAGKDGEAVGGWAQRLGEIGRYALGVAIEAGALR